MSNRTSETLKICPAEKVTVGSRVWKCAEPADHPRHQHYFLRDTTDPRDVDYAPSSAASVAEATEAIAVAIQTLKQKADWNVPSDVARVVAFNRGVDAAAALVRRLPDA